MSIKGSRTYYETRLARQRDIFKMSLATHTHKKEGLIVPPGVVKMSNRNLAANFSNCFVLPVVANLEFSNEEAKIERLIYQF